MTDVVYMHVINNCKDFEIKNVGESLALYLKSDTLLLADVLKNFWKMCLEIYHLDPLKFISAPELTSIFKKEWSKIRIINWYCYALNVWKRP